MWPLIGHMPRRRPLFWSASWPWPVRVPPAVPLVLGRTNRYQAFDAGLDPDEVAEARAWHAKFDPSQLPAGNTTFSRSSGPGGQHVNKTESKAITSWPLGSLLGAVPRLLHPGLRGSKYYVAGTGALTFQAQDSRARAGNVSENQAKLVSEVLRVYRDTVPGEGRPDKADKFAAV